MKYIKRKHLIVCIIILIFVILIIGLIHIINGINEQKRHDAAVEELQKYYNQKVLEFEEENKIQDSYDIVFIGDSLTDGCDLQKYYSEYVTTNRGIGGDTTFGVEKRLKISVFDIKSKVVVMLIGGNNLNTMFDNYEEILIKFKENIPNTKIVLVSLSAMGKDFKSKNEIAISNNTKIQALANKYNYEYVDIFSSLYNNKTKEIYEEYTLDGVHFTDEGYQIVTSKIKETLVKILNKKASQ